MNAILLFFGREAYDRFRKKKNRIKLVKYLFELRGILPTILLLLLFLIVCSRLPLKRVEEQRVFKWNIRISDVRRGART